MKNNVYKKRWPRKNLGELINFLESLHPEGLSLNVLASEIGITPGAISNLFMRDNMKLSKVEEIVGAYGYRLRLMFPVKSYPDFITPPSHNQNFDQAGNLKGLAQYIYDSNWTINSVATNMNMWPTMLSNAIHTGDILLSNLYKVTDQLGIYFYWHFEKKDN